LSLQFRRTLRPTIFPYTTLFRSDAFGLRTGGWSGTSFDGEWMNSAGQSGIAHNTKGYDADVELVYMYQRWYLPETGTFLSRAPRSEEHTSELQSRENLVCRLLLE